MLERLRHVLLLLIATLPVWNTSAESSDGVLARCGASKGRSYFLKDNITNPGGPNWEEDGITNGKIILVRLGKEWDIQFDDASGAYGYRQDGATVVTLGKFEDKLSIGAFRGTYSDIYTFDFSQEEVIWTSHKIGTAVPKVAIYTAKCEIISRP